MRMPEPRLPDLRGGPVLNWAVLAPGAIASAWTRAVLMHTDQRVVAVGSRSRERADAFAAEHGIATAFGSYAAAVEHPDVDIVYIAAPHTEHAALAELAIGAGKHILVEKPFAVTASEAERIAGAAREAGVFAMEAMWTRFHPWVDVADQLLVDGALGELRLISAEIGRRFPVDPRSRLYDPALAGGALLDMGVYAVWFAQHFGGAPLRMGVLGQNTATGVDAQSTIAMELAGDVHSVVTATLSAFTPSRAHLSGTEGMLVVEGRFPMPSALALHDRDGRLISRFDDTTGLEGHQALAREAVWAAIHVDAGRLEAPQHPLAASVGQLRTMDEARRQIALT